jgi:hypothetical protein
VLSTPGPAEKSTKSVDDTGAGDRPRTDNLRITSALDSESQE